MIKKCECCGAKIIEYKNTLNKGMVEALKKVYSLGGKAHLQNDLVLTKNQYNNFQKLQYFDLVKKHYNDDLERVSGVWDVTQRGENFLLGKISVNLNSIVYRNVRKEYTGEKVFVDFFFDKEYKKRQEYLDDSRFGEHHQKSNTEIDLFSHGI